MVDDPRLTGQFIQRLKDLEARFSKPEPAPVIDEVWTAPQVDVLPGRGGGLPAGNNRDVQFNNAGAFGGTDGLLIATSGAPNIAIELSGGGTEPAPAAGITEAVRVLAGRRVRVAVDPLGYELDFEPTWRGKRRVYCVGGGVGTSINDLIGMSISEFGSVAQINTGTADIVAQLPVRRYRTSATTTGLSAGWFEPTSAIYFRGNAAGCGGYLCSFRFYVPAFLTNGRLFVGLIAGAVATLINGADPSAATNFVGLVADAGDTNLQFAFNDGTGTGTANKQNLGSNFPVQDAASHYELLLGLDPNSSVFRGTLIRRTTGGVTYVTDFDSGASSDVPAVNTFLHPQMAIGTGTGSGSFPDLMFSNFCGYLRV